MARLAFAIVALLAVGSAAGLVVKKNAIHGALFLVVNLASVAVLYLMLGAEFLALAQVIIYAGAIIVLFVFAIMVLIPGKEETGPDPLRPWRLAALPLGGVLLLLLVWVTSRLGGPAGPAGPAAGAGNVATLARLLFTDYLFPFELTSVLLLAAMVGVLVLARRRA
jgi:NADH-quinone oxidoreductase subunit J